MNYVSINLTVPPEWKQPDTLKSLTPEDTALVIDSGCRILNVSRSESAGINNKEEKKLLKMQSDNEILEIQKRFDRDSQEALRKFKEHEKTLNEKIVSQEKTIELECNKAESALAAKRASESQIRESINDETSRYRSEISTITEKNDQLHKEMIKMRSSLELEKQEMLYRQIEEAKKEREKITEDARKEREKFLETISMLQGRKANSSFKGGDNEREFIELLKNTFGTSESFNLLKKELNAGDNRIDWEGFRIMIENKIGYTESALRGKDGVPKAIKDFTQHTDCNALIFISEDTAVPDHTKPGDIDISMVDGRLAIFIGNFSRQQSKSEYFTTLLIPILRVGLKLFKKSDRSDLNDVNRIKQVMNLLSRLKGKIVERLGNYKNKLNEFERNQKSWLSELKSLVESDTTFIVSAMTDILGDGSNDHDTPVSDSSPDIKTYNREALIELTVDNLIPIAKQLKIIGYSKMNKTDLINKILEAQAS